MLSRRSTAITLALILAAAAWVRLGSVGRLVPQRPEPDAHLVTQFQARAGQPLHKWQLAYVDFYPSLLPRTLALAAGVAPFERAPGAASLEEHLRAAARPYTAMRILAALLSSLAVPLVYCVARRFLDPLGALLAAAFQATALMHVVFSSAARPHGPCTTLIWLALLCSLRWIEAPNVARMCSAAAATALAIGCFQTGLFAAAALLAAIPIAARGSRKLGLLGLAALLGALAAGWGFYPSAPEVSGDGVSLAQGGHTIRFEYLNGLGAWVSARHLWGYDPVLGVLAAIGALVALSRWRTASAGRRASALVIAAFAVPYAALLALNELTLDRFLLPLYPLACLFAATAVRALLARLPHPALRALAVAAALAFPAWCSWRFLALSRAPDTLELAARWLAEQPGSDSARVLVTPFLALPLFSSPEAIAEQWRTRAGQSAPWIEYQRGLGSAPASAPGFELLPIRPKLLSADPSPSVEELVAELDAARPDYIVLEVSQRVHSAPSAAALESVVRGCATMLAEFRGETGERIDSIDYQDVEQLALRLLSATAFGPRVEAYAWPAR